MKKITLILGLALFFSLFAFNNSVSAQAIVDHDSQFYLTVGGDVDLPSTYNLIVITPSGNALFNLDFQLSEFNTLIPENGVAKYDIAQSLLGFWVTGKLVVTSNGSCKIVLHGEPL